MFLILRQILRTGILTEPAPDADDTLRETQQRLSDVMRRITRTRIGHSPR